MPNLFWNQAQSSFLFMKLIKRLSCQWPHFCYWSLRELASWYTARLAHSTLVPSNWTVVGPEESKPSFTLLEKLMWLLRPQCHQQPSICSLPLMFILLLTSFCHANMMKISLWRKLPHTHTSPTLPCPHPRAKHNIPATQCCQQVCYTHTLSAKCSSICITSFPKCFLLKSCCNLFRSSEPSVVGSMKMHFELADIIKTHKIVFSTLRKIKVTVMLHVWSRTVCGKLCVGPFLIYFIWWHVC